MSVLLYWSLGLPLSVAAIVAAQRLLAGSGCHIRSRRWGWALWVGVVLAPVFLPLGYSTGAAPVLGAVLLTSWLASEAGRVWPQAEFQRGWRQAACVARWAAGFSVLWFLGRLWPGPDASDLERLLNWGAWGVAILLAGHDWARASASPAPQECALQGRDAAWVAPCSVVPLLVLLALALGGYWPGSDPSEREWLVTRVAWGLAILLAEFGWARACASPAPRARVAHGHNAAWVAPCAVVPLFVLGALTPSLVGPTFASLSVAFLLSLAVLVAMPLCLLAGARIPQPVIVTALFVLLGPLPVGFRDSDAELDCSIGEVLEAGELPGGVLSGSSRGPYVVMGVDSYSCSLFDLSGEDPRWWDRRSWRRRAWMPSCSPRDRTSPGSP